ncbi:MAG: hypothetical protein ACXIUZ_14230 [Lysobacteraceae bacterium]
MIRSALLSSAVALATGLGFPGVSSGSGASVPVDGFASIVDARDVSLELPVGGRTDVSVMATNARFVFNEHQRPRSGVPQLVDLSGDVSLSIDDWVVTSNWVQIDPAVGELIALSVSLNLAPGAYESAASGSVSMHCSGGVLFRNGESMGARTRDNPYQEPGFNADIYCTGGGDRIGMTIYPRQQEP